MSEQIISYVQPPKKQPKAILLVDIHSRRCQACKKRVHPLIKFSPLIECRYCKILHVIEWRIRLGKPTIYMLRCKCLECHKGWLKADLVIRNKIRCTHCEDFFYIPNIDVTLYNESREHYFARIKRENKIAQWQEYRRRIPQFIAYAETFLANCVKDKYILNK